jgi:hypothetical protein
VPGRLVRLTGPRPWWWGRTRRARRDDDKREDGR